LGTWVTGVAIGPHGTVFGSGGAWDEICLKASATTVTCVRTSQDTSEIFIPFVVSFDARGFVRWMRTVDDSEGGLTGAGGSIAVDRRGRAIVADTYVGPITFGSGEPNATRLTGDAGLYVAQYRPDGRLGWAVRALGSFGGDQIAVVADPAANAVIAGTFVGRAVFAPDLPQQRVLDAVGERDAFIAKYDGAGRLLWARRLGGAGDERLGGLATDAEGRLFALIATDDRVAVSRFGPSGRLHLTRPLSGVATATAIAAGPDGTIAVTGSFRDGATFGAGEPTAVTLKAASGEGDAFVARYTGTGRFVSVVPIVGGGTPSRESPAGVAIDAGSRVIVAGDASSPIRVGRGTDARFWRYGLYGSIYLGTFAAPDAAPDAGTGAGTGGATAD
jgi:hypothetical protein